MLTRTERRFPVSPIASPTQSSFNIHRTCFDKVTREYVAGKTYDLACKKSLDDSPLCMHVHIGIHTDCIRMYACMNVHMYTYMYVKRMHICIISDLLFFLLLFRND